MAGNKYEAEKCWVEGGCGEGCDEQTELDDIHPIFQSRPELKTNKPLRWNSARAVMRERQRYFVEKQTNIWKGLAH